MTAIEGGVAVVTGAASGIGRAVAARFATAGMTVVLADVDEALLDETVQELAAEVDDVVGRATDVSDAGAVEDLAAECEDRFGTPTVVCNNAGTLAGGPTWSIDPVEWRRVLDVNLMGVVHGIVAFVPRMLRAGRAGHVVNVASMAGVVTLPGIGPYVASKQAVVGVSESLHAELEEAGAPIRVSVVCPGYVPSRLGAADRRAEPGAPAPGALDAADVAEAVLAAVVDDRFYVFTHPGSETLVSKRFDAIVHGHQPWTMG